MNADERRNMNWIAEGVRALVLHRATEGPLGEDGALTLAADAAQFVRETFEAMVEEQRA